MESVSDHNKLKVLKVHETLNITDKHSYLKCRKSRLTCGFLPPVWDWVYPISPTTPIISTMKENVIKTVTELLKENKTEIFISWITIPQRMFFCHFLEIISTNEVKVVGISGIWCFPRSPMVVSLVNLRSSLCLVGLKI